MAACTFQTSRVTAPRRWLMSPQLGLATATLLWAGNFVMGRALRAEIDPLALNFWRWCIAAIVLCVFVLPTLLEQWHIMRRHLALIAGLGLTGIAVPHSCVYAALQSTSAVNALLFLNLVPVLVALGARLLFLQPIHPRQWLGIGICVAGAASLLVRWDPAVLRDLHFTTGDLWMIPAIAGGAAQVLLLKRTPPGITQGPLLFASIIAALLMMVPGLVWTGETGISMLTGHWASVLYMGVFASAAAFFLWNRGVADLGPQRAAPFMYLMPLYGALLSISFLGEPPHGYQLAGGAVVLAGLWLARPAKSRA